MSNVFDGLSRAQGSVPGLDVADLIGAQELEPAAQPSRPDVDLTDLVGPGMIPQGSAPLARKLPIEQKSEQKSPAPMAPPAAPGPTVATVPAETAQLVPRRTISLRLPRTSPALPFDGKHGVANEQYRILRTKLLQHPRQPRVILISSTGPGDGKSVTSINLAGVLALRAEGHVLLLDSDFRKATIHLHLGTPETPGLAEVLAGTSSLEEAVVGAQELPNLFVLPAGKTVGNSAELLDSSRWAECMSTLRKTFKYIIVDSPPIASVADYDLLASAADGVVVVVRPDHTNRQRCNQVLASLPKEKVIGILLNWVPDWFLGKHWGFSYGSGASYY